MDAIGDFNQNEQAGTVADVTWDQGVPTEQVSECPSGAALGRTTEEASEIITD